MKHQTNSLSILKVNNKNIDTTTILRRFVGFIAANCEHISKHDFLYSFITNRNLSNRNLFSILRLPTIAMEIYILHMYICIYICMYIYINKCIVLETTFLLIGPNCASIGGLLNF